MRALAFPWRSRNAKSNRVFAFPRTSSAGMRKPSVGIKSVRSEPGTPRPGQPERVSARQRRRSPPARRILYVRLGLAAPSGAQPDTAPTESRGWCGSIRYFTRCSDSIDPPLIGLSAWRAPCRSIPNSSRPVSHRLGRLTGSPGASPMLPIARSTPAEVPREQRGRDRGRRAPTAHREGRRAGLGDRGPICPHHLRPGGKITAGSSAWRASSGSRRRRSWPHRRSATNSSVPSRTHSSGKGVVRMLANDETALRSFCARILGWEIELTGIVEHAIRSIHLSVMHRAALVLLGDTDLVPIARALHRRTIGVDRPFIVCDRRRRNLSASVRSPMNHEGGLDAFSSCPRGLPVHPTRAATADFLCRGGVASEHRGCAAHRLLGWTR